MEIFSDNSNGSVTAWGPAATMAVKVPSLSAVVGSDKPWCLTNFSIGAREITDIRQCFNDVSYIYALGNDQNQCQISLTFVIFIGRKNCSGTENTSTIGIGLTAYKNKRISQNTSGETIVIGNFAVNGWIRGIDIGNLDPSKGVCYGTVHFIMELKGPSSK